MLCFSFLRVSRRWRETPGVENGLVDHHLVITWGGCALFPHLVTCEQIFFEYFPLPHNTFRPGDVGTWSFGRFVQNLGVVICGEDHVLEVGEDVLVFLCDVVVGGEKGIVAIVKREQLLGGG